MNIATDNSGNIVQTAFYYPFGGTCVNTGTVDLHYKFTGQESDPESSLYYYGARYYDPLLGRFISADTTVQAPKDPQTLNRYSYCRNNPLAFVDPTGHSFLSFFENFISALLGAGVTVLSWGTAGPIVAGMLGGMMAGFTSAAMHGGNLIAVVQGAALGGIGGAIAGGLYMANVPWEVMAAAGAGIAGGTGGVKGLEHFAAGFAGGLARGLLGGYLNKAVNSNIVQTADYKTDVERYYSSMSLRLPTRRAFTVARSQRACINITASQSQVQLFNGLPPTFGPGFYSPQTCQFRLQMFGLAPLMMYISAINRQVTIRTRSITE